MGKRRKTYKEKLIADLRRKVYNLEGLNATSFELEKKHQTANTPSSTHIAAVLQNPAERGYNQYPYLLKDISKTGILTASVIGIQIILFFILKKHILVLPGISY